MNDCLEVYTTQRLQVTWVCRGRVRRLDICDNLTADGQSGTFGLSQHQDVCCTLYQVESRG
jgi:hypothetical protein